MSLQDKTVLVTGGSRGIGAAIVQDLVASGAKVGFTYQSRADAAEALCEELGVDEDRCQAFACDSRDFEAVKATLKEIESRLGTLYGLVNNAGITRDKILVMMKAEDWQDVIDTDLTGVFHFCKAAIFGMTKRKSGRIITIGSVSGLIGNKGQVNYSAAKAGVIGLSKALAKEVARYGITANVIAPGYIETEMTEKLGENVMEKMKEYIPMRRFGEASDVAALTRYLLDRHAGYITGQVFTIDGGLAI